MPVVLSVRFVVGAPLESSAGTLQNGVQAWDASGVVCASLELQMYRPRELVSGFGASTDQSTDHHHHHHHVTH
jgi:hypothetical protein